MPSKKKKYNARFPAGRIKKIMQTDEDIGKVAQAVPIIISRTLELFVESLLTKSALITQTRNAKTLTPSHMKQCILSESRFDFLKDLVKDVPDATSQEDSESPICDVFDSFIESNSQNNCAPPLSPTSKKGEFPANFYTEQGPSTAETIAYGQKNSKIDFAINSLVQKEVQQDVPPEIRIDLSNIIRNPELPRLVPISRTPLCENNADDLCIDEDYDN